jgi:hypothetical protein
MLLSTYESCSPRTVRRRVGVMQRAAWYWLSKPVSEVRQLGSETLTPKSGESEDYVKEIFRAWGLKI